MGYGPTKRVASASPDRRRPNKRPATSSPEEGELDEVSQSTSARPPSPPPQSPAKFETKVKFPFKKKIPGEEGRLSPRGEKERVPASYERLAEDDRRMRQGDRQSGSTLPPPREQHRRQNVHHWQPGDRWESTADRWDPSVGSSRDRDRDRDRDGRRVRDRDRERERDRDRDARPYDDQRGARHRPTSSTDSRDHSYHKRDHEGDRGRARSPRAWSSHSSASPSRSTSSASPSGSGKVKHRLPPARASPSPPRDYRSDRAYSRDGRDRYDDSYDLRRGDSFNNWRRDTHGQYHRSPPEDYHGDRYSRGDYSPGPSYRDSSNIRPRAEVYRPSGVPSLPPRPAGPSHFLNPQTPPLPPSPPPPPLPPAPQPMKSSALPPTHTMLSIPLPKKPSTPKDAHSPPPLPLPAAEDEAVHKREESQRALAPKANDARRKQKREPVHRSREDEQKAYGRMFVGCGRQEDYDVTTKLGEGTFGFVRLLHGDTAY